MRRILFEKTGNAIYISHRDLMRLFQRAFKRGGLNLKHTQGFSPRAMVSIALPMSVGVRLLHLVPAALTVACTFLFGSIWIPMVLVAYYILIGFTLSRFVTASYTNAQFDKFINSRIEGAQVNRGLAEEEDEDWEEEEERELKPWENGYVNKDN